MFCDFTIDYVITKVMKREYRNWERKCVKIQDLLIQNTDYFACIFPQAGDYYRDYYKREVITINGHIINCHEKVEDI